MSNKQNDDEIRLPTDEADVIEMAGADTDEEKALADSQARIIGDID